MGNEYRVSVKQYVWLLAIFAAVVCFGALGTRELASGDETRVAGIGAEMAVTGDFVVPRLNGSPFLEYPPAYYWLEAIGFRSFGFVDWAAKLPSALAGWLGALLVFALGRKLRFGVAASFLAGIMLVTGAQYFANSRTCMVDMLLAFFVLAAVYAFAGMLNAGSSGRRWCWWIGFGAALGGGVLTKGLIGIVLPVAALGIFLVLDDWQHRRIGWIRYQALAGGILLGLAPVAVWVWALYGRAGYDAVHEVVVVNNFGRFTGSQGDHVEAIYYYLAKLPQQFQPWLILLPGGLWLLWRRGRTRKRQGALLVLCFLVVPYLVLTVASSKRQVYLLPLYAPAALAAGSFAVWGIRRLPGWLRWIGRPLPNWLWRVPGGILLLAAAVFLILAPGWNRVWPLAALVIAGLTVIRKICWERYAVLLLLGLAFFYASIDAAVLARQNEEESLDELFDYCRQAEADGIPVILVDPSERIRGAAYYYLQRLTPERKMQEYDGRSLELWVMRDKSAVDGLPFADNHQVYRVPYQLPATFWSLLKRRIFAIPAAGPDGSAAAQ